jgi:hypothetical protein
VLGGGRVSPRIDGVTGERSWDLVFERRPETVNHLRTVHHMERARIDKRWRAEAGWLARAARIPKLDRIIVTAAPFVRNRRSMPDVAACIYAVKAAIDGLVDARVIPDDKPAHLSALTFVAPQVADDGIDRLVLIVQEDPHQ